MEIRSSPLCGCPTAARPHIYGRTDMGVVQPIPQGEGGEQGDPPHAHAFCIGAAPGPRSDSGHIATLEPDRVIEAHTVVAEELWSHARIQVHLGKTQVWNRGGIEPAGMDELTRAARLVKPDAIVWKGDPQLFPLQQGLKVLGVPIGQPEFIREFLQRKSGEQATLFERIPWVNDPQVAYLLLFMCGSTRANFLLRAINPRSLPRATTALCGDVCAQSSVRHRLQRMRRSSLHCPSLVAVWG